MTNNTVRVSLTAAALLALAAGAPTASAYTCNAAANEAQRLIGEAESKMSAKTDSRVKAMVAEAKGLLAASKLSHGQASERHHGDKGKFMHGDAVRQARWAASLAKEAIFLITEEPR